jgi:uncharacterized repeat protein (TIGR01451 family)
MLAGTAIAVPGYARAAGTPAGTAIVNVASADYVDENSIVRTVTSNSVTIRVEEVLDVTVSPLGAQPQSVVPGAPEYRLTYRVTNDGNGPEAFGLQAGTAIGGDVFDPTLIRVAVDRDGDGVYNPLVDTDFAPGAEPVLAPDTSVDVFVFVGLPSDVANGDDGLVNLTARALTGSGVPGTLFAGLGAGASDAVVGNSGAEALASGALLVAIAQPTLVKTQDAVGQPTSGSIVTYTISADLAGSGAVAPTIVDAIPPGVTYVAGSLTLAGSALTDAADADPGVFTGISIEVALSETAAGPQVVTFQVRVN